MLPSASPALATLRRLTPSCWRRASPAGSSRATCAPCTVGSRRCRRLRRWRWRCARSRRRRAGCARAGALIESEPAPIVRLRPARRRARGGRPSWRRALAAAVARVCTEGDAMPALEAGLPNDRGLVAGVERSAGAAHAAVGRFGRAISARSSRACSRPCATPCGSASCPTSWPRDWSSCLTMAARRRHHAAVRPAQPGHARRDRARRHAHLGARPVARDPRAQPGGAAGGVAVLPLAAPDATRSSPASARRRRAATRSSACRDALETVRAHLEEFGVSVDVVYRLEVIAKNLDRLRDLLAVVGGALTPTPRRRRPSTCWRTSPRRACAIAACATCSRRTCSCWRAR